MNFIIAQVLGLIGSLIFVISFYQKSTKKIILFQTISLIFSCMNYIFLGAYSGIVVIAIELLRNVLYYLNNDSKKSFHYIIPFYILLTIVNYNNIIAIFPVIASLTESYSLTEGKHHIAVSGLFVYCLWIQYNMFINNHVGVLFSTLIVLSNLYVLVYEWLLKISISEIHITNSQYISKNLLQNISNIAKTNKNRTMILDDEYIKNMYYNHKHNFSFIKYNDLTIGYINYLVLTKEKYIEIINNKIKYTNIESADIIPYKHEENYVIIDSIVIKEDYINDNTIGIIRKGIFDYLDYISKKNYKLTNIVGIATSDLENEIFDSKKIRYVKKLKDNSKLYSLKD